MFGVAVVEKGFFLEGSFQDVISSESPIFLGGFAAGKGITLLAGNPDVLPCPLYGVLFSCFFFVFFNSKLISPLWFVFVICHQGAHDFAPTDSGKGVGGCIP